MRTKGLKQLEKSKGKFKMEKFIKKAGITLLLVCAIVISNAQVQYGIKANFGGTCQSDLLEIAQNCDNRLTYSFGAVAKYQFTECFALKSGLEFQQKGRELDENGIELSNKVKYLTLPLKAEFSAGEKAGFKNGQRLFFTIGPYLGYMLDAEEELNGTTSDITDDTKNFDTGLSFEIGFEFPVFNEKALQLGLNYDMGFVEIYKSEPDLHNKMATISLAMMF